jgi:3-oxoadipate enol-lactonase
MAPILDVGDLHVRCSVSGDGPPLLLIHGAEGSHRMFDDIVPHLAPHFTVIAYDQRDCGETTNPDASSTLDDLACDALGLLQALGHQRAHVFGHSFGGRVAQCLALRHPEAVERLVLGSTWPLPHALGALNPVGVAQIQALRDRLPDSADELVAYFLPSEFLDANPRFRQIFRHASPRSARSQRRVQTVADAPALDPRQLAMPTLLLAGSLDRVVPPDAMLGMAALIPHALAVRLDGVGHAGIAQAPEAVAAHIRRFLQREATPALENT